MYQIDLIREDLVSFEAKSVDSLKTAFQESVEDYLDICRCVWSDRLLFPVHPARPVILSFPNPLI